MTREIIRGFIGNLNGNANWKVTAPILVGGKVFYDRADLNAWVATEKAATARGG